MNRFIFPILLLLAACGGPVEKSPPTVIADDEGSNTSLSNNNGPTESSNNKIDPPGCCDGRECGSAPGCEESCGSCDVDAFCDEGGVCVQVAPDAPQILDLSTNTSSITENGSVSFSVIVTDPDGIDDLIGGTLKSPDGASYGSFQTAAAEGAYSLTVTWGEMNTVQPILFEGTGERVFVAEFYDQAGNRVQREAVIGLYCEQSGSACEPGRCFDTNANNSHCGACGNEVPEGSGAWCQDGAPSCQDGGGGEYCPDSGSCAGPYNPEACGSCGNECSQLAVTLGVSLDGENEAGCTSTSVCRLVIETTSLASCDEQCGPLTCVDASARYFSLRAENCDHEWEADQHIYTRCVCE